MPAINKNLHNVMVLMTVPAEKANEFQRLATATLPIFEKQPGFVSATLHKSADGSKFIQYLQWQTKAQSDACMMSPDWMAEAGQQYMGFVQANGVEMLPMDVEIVEIREK